MGSCMEHDLELTCKEIWRVAALDQFEPPVVRGRQAVDGRVELFIRDVPAIRHASYRKFCSEILTLGDIKLLRAMTLTVLPPDGNCVEVMEPSAEDLKELYNIL